MLRRGFWTPLAAINPRRAADAPHSNGSILFRSKCVEIVMLSASPVSPTALACHVQDRVRCPGAWVTGAAQRAAPSGGPVRRCLCGAREAGPGSPGTLYASFGTSAHHRGRARDHPPALLRRRADPCGRVRVRLAAAQKGRSIGRVDGFIMGLWALWGHFTLLVVRLSGVLGLWRARVWATMAFSEEHRSSSVTPASFL